MMGSLKHFEALNVLPMKEGRICLLERLGDLKGENCLMLTQAPPERTSGWHM